MKKLVSKLFFWNTQNRLINWLFQNPIKNYGIPLIRTRRDLILKKMQFDCLSIDRVLHVISWKGTVETGGRNESNVGRGSKKSRMNSLPLEEWESGIVKCEHTDTSAHLSQAPLSFTPRCWSRGISRFESLPLSDRKSESNLV